MTDETKRCTQCALPKPLDDFDKKASSKDGRRSKCKKCRRNNREKKRAEAEAKRKAYRSPFTTPINISVSNELLQQVDQFVKQQGIRSRSELYAHAVRLYMSKALLCGMCGEVIGGKHYCGDCLLSYARRGDEDN